MDFDPIQFERICDGVGNGESLARMLAAESPKLAYCVFYTWLESSAERQERYARARDRNCESHFDQIQAIADDAMNATTQEQAQAYKLRVEARKWIVCKLKPRKYGDKLGLEHSGQIGVHDALADALKRERDLKKPDAGA